MHRLGEMSDRQRLRVGGGSLVVGLILMIVGVTIVHVYGRGSDNPPPAGFFLWMFELLDTDAQKFGKGFGYLVVFAASQLIIVGAALVWILNQRMTWARAAFAALLTWIELVVIFGIVPSEWLNFSQTDLDWSTQRPVPGLDPLPPWLVLNNEVTISWGAVKDAISGGYNVTMLVLAGLFAYKLQDVGKPRPQKAPEEKISPYGRPLISQPKGEA